VSVEQNVSKKPTFLGPTTIQTSNPFGTAKVVLYGRT
jgi:hypothetical protein